MYMIPMRLWSAVVSHDVQPLGAGRTLRATTWGAGASVGVVGAVVAAKIAS